jgi:hypothetical protein
VTVLSSVQFSHGENFQNGNASDDFMDSEPEVKSKFNWGKGGRR